MIRQQRPAEAADEPALHEEIVDALLVVAAAGANVAKRAHDLDQHEQIDERDQIEKERRNGGADRRSHVLQSRKRASDRGGREGDRNGQCDDDRRVPERKEKPDGNRALVLRHQLSRDVVDRRNVIRVDRVPQPEGEGEQRRADQGGAPVKDDEREDPRSRVGRTKQDVHEHDPSAHVGRVIVEDPPQRGQIEPGRGDSHRV